MPARRRDARTVHEIAGFVIVEPRFAGLKARYDRMPRFVKMCRRVFAQRLVAASDVTALRASPQMEPPRIFRHAFNASGAGGFNAGVNAFHFATYAAPRRAACAAQVVSERCASRRSR